VLTAWYNFVLWQPHDDLHRDSPGRSFAPDGSRYIGVGPIRLSKEDQHTMPGTKPQIAH
jgi:hypothetical protein